MLENNRIELSGCNPVFGELQSVHRVGQNRYNSKIYLESSTFCGISSPFEKNSSEAEFIQ